MISPISEQGTAAPAASAKHCVFVTVNNEKNPLSVQILQKMAVDALHDQARSDKPCRHHIHICRSEDEARQFQGKNVVGVYDSGDYGGYYSPSLASKVRWGKPAWIGGEGYVVSVKKTLTPRHLERKEQILATRIDMCARQLSTIFAKVGTVSDEALFGTPSVSWRQVPAAATGYKNGSVSGIRMKSDRVCG